MSDESAGGAGQRRICVIGGGAAGLAAAWRLQARGAAVTLFEQSPEAGGLLSTVNLGGADLGADLGGAESGGADLGVRADTAVQLLSATYTRLFALASEAGCSDLLVRASGRDALWRKGGAQEITYGSIPSMITSGALPTMLKLKLGAKYVPFLTMQAQGLDANDPAATGGSRWDGESITAWGRREIGDDFVEYLAYPLLAAYYGSPPEDATAAMYHALALVGMDVQVYAARGGMRVLARALTDALRARGVTVVCDAAVQSLDPAGERWEVLSREAKHVFDAVVVATPPAVAAELVRSAGSQQLSAWLAGARTRPAATLSLALSGTLRAEWFGLSFPRTDPPGDRIVAVAVQQNKPANLLKPGASALTIFPAPGIVKQVAGMDERDATDLLGPALETVFPGALRRVTAAKVNVWQDGYRSIAPGFVRRISELRTMKMPGGLALAGDYTMAPTVEGAVRSGEGAADRLFPADLPADHPSDLRDRRIQP